MSKQIFSRIAFYGYIFAVVGTVGIFILAKNLSRTLIFEMILGVTILYLISALTHHIHDKSLTFEIVIEYILLAALAVVMLVSFFV